MTKKTLIPAILIIGFAFLFSRCTLAPSSAGREEKMMAPEDTRGIYVTTNGNDSASGTNASEPIITIQTALEKAAASGLAYVYVAEGLYTNSGGLKASDGTTNTGIWITNSGIHLMGGYGEGFTNRSGKTVLDGKFQLRHIIIIGDLKTPLSDITVDGFIIRGGVSSNIINKGGGMYAKFLSGSVITNCVVSNNFVGGTGGGFCLENSTNNRISADIIANNASIGGGMDISQCAGNIFNCSVSENSATAGGGMYSLLSLNNVYYCLVSKNRSISTGGGVQFMNCYLETFRGSAVSNISSTEGGGIYLSFCSNCRIDSSVLYNKSTNNYGGGIYIQNTCNFIGISGNISSNSVIASKCGGGLMIMGSNTVISNAVIAGNTASYGGGLYISANGIIVTNSLINDNTSEMGGGIFAGIRLNNIRIFADIFHNSTTICGGGIYAGYVTNFFFQGSVNSNTDTGNGGAGFYLNNGSNVTINGMMNGNVSSMEGTLYAYGTINLKIEADMINNNVQNGYGGALYFRFTTNLQIINGILTNNRSLNPCNVIHLEDGNSLVMISNCMIGSYANSATYGIYERTTETAGHILVDNIFLTNYLQYLYRDYSGTTVNADAGWTNINIESFSDAALADRNTVQ